MSSTTVTDTGNPFAHVVAGYPGWAANPSPLPKTQAALDECVRRAAEEGLTLPANAAKWSARVLFKAVDRLEDGYDDESAMPARRRTLYGELVRYAQHFSEWEQSR